MTVHEGLWPLRPVKVAVPSPGDPDATVLSFVPCQPPDHYVVVTDMRGGALIVSHWDHRYGD